MSNNVTIETYVNSEKAAMKIVKAVVVDKKSPTAHVDEVASYYWWDGELVQEKEFRISFDAPAPAAVNIIDTIKKAHPYELPAICLYPLQPGTKDTEKWLADPTYHPSK